jgi:acyl-CoA reductase-like NAD-dependent aldehyde dehydrogenase
MLQSLYEIRLLLNSPIHFDIAFRLCALITPWNWPINQIACKVLPALAAGCTMVLKPSEVSPLSAMIWAKVMEDAGIPPGVFNLVNGDGAPPSVPH